MEAKVDVQKLQLLNDRIAQTIEALNQVRLSVHGLSHTPILPSPMPFTGASVPYTFGMPQLPIYPYQGAFPGLQHTPFTNPYTMTHFPGFAPSFPGITPPSFPLFPPPFMSGLSHTSPEVLDQRFNEIKAVDPYRLAQTFPFMNAPIWPAIW